MVIRPSLKSGGFYFFFWGGVGEASDICGWAEITLGQNGHVHVYTVNIFSYSLLVDLRIFLYIVFLASLCIY